MVGSLVDILGRIAAEHESTPDMAATVVVGLAGRGIQSSRSPAMHEREARRLGIGYSYILLDFDQLAFPMRRSAMLSPLRGRPASRVSTSRIPSSRPSSRCSTRCHRRRARSAPSTRSSSAAMHGPQHRQLGFCGEFPRTWPASRPTQSRIGAGGAGAAVAYALMELGVGRVVVVDSDAAKAADLAAPRMGTSVSRARGGIVRSGKRRRGC